MQRGAVRARRLFSIGGAIEINRDRSRLPVAAGRVTGRAPEVSVGTGVCPIEVYGGRRRSPVSKDQVTLLRGFCCRAAPSAAEFVGDWPEEQPQDPGLANWVAVVSASALPASVMKVRY